MQRIRFHQSWYRAAVLKAPYGTGPKQGNSTFYGNMLTREDGERGLNFLTPHIFEIAKRRLARKDGMVEAFRLKHNLLSSQTMCFNLFGPLVDDIELAEDILRALLPDEIQAVVKVSLEYAPEPVKDYLNDRTAFDAFVAYTSADGQPGFVGIETRLAEAFSPKVYSGPSYSRWLEHPQAPWPAGNHAQLQTIQVNPLWRKHLLATAMKLSPASPFTKGKFMLVYHPLDAECTAAITVYQTLLHPADDTFIALPLDRLVELWASVVRSPAHKRWIEDFSRRYLDLEASEAAFLAQ